jgi:hypothetical protein
MRKCVFFFFFQEVIHKRLPRVSNSGNGLILTGVACSFEVPE